MQKKEIPFLASELNKLFPNASTELFYENDFQLLIAILMSAQTTDKQVNKVNKIFFKYLKEPKDGLDLGVEKIKNFIKTVSFFNNKATNIYKTCEKLVKAKNKIPKNIDDLTKLNGVGIKTAKVFLAVSENAPYIGVDTHVHRVLNRLGLVNTKTPLETDKKISSGFTKENHALLHNTLVLFGRYYCTAKNPKCKDCIFNEKCKYGKKILKK